LRASFDSAENQTNNIIKKFSYDPTEVAKAKPRLIDIQTLRENSQL
jgi:hypothetical protein